MNAVKDDIDDIIKFCETELDKKLARDDFKELLELTLVFLGSDSHRGGYIHFRKPGPMHHARWMSKALYALKVFMFLEQFTVSRKDATNLRDVCVFVVRFYVIHAYANIDKVISSAVTKKFGTHLWYLGDETIALAFFDDNVTTEEKRMMRDTFLAQPEIDESTTIFRLVIPPSRMHNIHEWQLHNFITENTINFFDRFKFSTEFLQKDPTEWSADETYTQMKDDLRYLEVVNDHAERAVKLFTDFNRSLTKNEEQKQYLLQVVTDYRKRVPDATKTTLAQL